MRKLLLSVFSIFLNVAVFAQDSTLTETPAAGTFAFSGYLDTYYFGNFNNPRSQSNAGTSGVARAFDTRAGQFGIGLVQGKAAYTSAKIDAVFDIALGPFADLGNYGNAVGPLGLTRTSTSLAIKQAFIAWKPGKNLTLTAGQFGTHIGYEVIDAPVNYNYSLSYLFNNGPFYHVGLKGQYSFGDRAYLMVGLVNNVDNIFDNNKAKGVISQLFFSPVSGWNVYLNAIVSNEGSLDSSNGPSIAGNAYSVFDLTTTYQITEKFFLGFNGAIGSHKGNYQGVPIGNGSESLGWSGAAVYTNYAFSSGFGLGARFENFNNASAARALLAQDGSGTTVNALTLTANITTADGHLLLKPELRVDSFDKNQFEDGDGNLKKSQTTLGMAAIFKF
jgi:hypothetical protein